MYRSNKLEKFLILLSILTFFSVILYTINTTLLVISNTNNFIHITFNIVGLLFETITALYGVFLLLHIAYIFKPHFEYNFPEKIDLNPLVSIIIPTYNPNLYAVETILLNLQKITYKNVEIFITDNSDSNDIIQELEALSNQFKINFLHRTGIQGFKARNLNNVLPKIKGDYFFIIDIDQSIKPNAIEKMVFVFENEKKREDNLAYIQGQFEIKNANNIIRNSIAILYTFFYHVISLAKSSRGTVLFNGSSACFNSKIIKEIGGFPEDSYTEDIEISYKLLLNGFRSLYLNINVTTALVPWTITDLVSSFWRWTYGGTSILRKNSKNIIKSKKLSFSKKIELIMNGFSFIAFSSLLILVGMISIMFWTNIELVRPILYLYGINLPLILIFPSIITISLLFSCIIGMIESKTLFRLPYLIPYSLASISISYFIILPTLYSILGIKNVDKSTSKWSRKINIDLSVLVLLLISLYWLSTFWMLFIANDLLWLSFFLTSMVTIITIFFLLDDKNISSYDEDMKYYANFRKLNDLRLDSKYKIII